MTGQTSSRQLPLAGFRIISAEQYGAGPYGTQFLAQLGADVIKIEPPHKEGKGGGDTARAVGPHYLREGESHYFHAFNLNKRSLTLDLNSSDGQAILHRLVATADAVVNNLRGDLPDRLGLTYAALSPIRPAIVCAHLSAYGRNNERSKWPGYDYLMQAEAGFCMLTGDPDGEPQRFGLSMVDYMTGTQMAVGVLAALLDAQRCGLGRDIDCDLLSTAVHQMTYPAVWYLNEGTKTGRTPRSAHPTATPSQMVKASDGWMFVMCQLPKFWTIFVERVDHPALRDERFASNAGRLAHRGALTETIDTIFSTHPVAHWLALLQGHVPVAPVNDIADAMDNPWLETIGMIETVTHPDRDDLRVLASPIKVDGQRPPSQAGPLLGADSEAILKSLGYAVSDIALLHKKGVI